MRVRVLVVWGNCTLGPPRDRVDIDPELIEEARRVCPDATGLPPICGFAGGAGH